MGGVLKQALHVIFGNLPIPTRYRDDTSGLKALYVIASNAHDDVANGDTCHPLRFFDGCAYGCHRLVDIHDDTPVQPFGFGYADP